MAWKKLSGDLAPSWDKVKQKSIEGVITDRREHVGQYDSTVYTIEQKGGEKLAVWAKGSLEGMLKPLLVGTVVRITWKGLVKTKNGRQANAFDVEVEDQT